MFYGITVCEAMVIPIAGITHALYCMYYVFGSATQQNHPALLKEKDFEQMPESVQLEKRCLGTLSASSLQSQQVTSSAYG